MLRLTFIFTLLLMNLSVLDIYAQADENNRGYITQVGEMAPNLELNMLDGTSQSLEELRGKVVVLQFTASWCSVCRKEMPHLENEVWLPNKDDEFVLIGVDIDENTSKITPFIEKMEVTYPIAIDSNKANFYKFASRKAGVTRNVVINKEGKIAFQTRLFDHKEFEEMKSVITNLLKG